MSTRWHVWSISFSFFWTPASPVCWRNKISSHGRWGWVDAAGEGMQWVRGAGDGGGGGRVGEGECIALLRRCHLESPSVLTSFLSPRRPPPPCPLVLLPHPPSLPPSPSHLSPSAPPVGLAFQQQRVRGNLQPRCVKGRLWWVYMCMCMCVYVCVCVSCKNCTTPIGSPPALFKWNRGSLLVHPVALRNGNLILLYHLLETMSHSSVATMLLQHLGCHGGEQQSLCGPRPINPG